MNRSRGRGRDKAGLPASDAAWYRADTRFSASLPASKIRNSEVSQWSFLSALHNLEALALGNIEADVCCFGFLKVSGVGRAPGVTRALGATALLVPLLMFLCLPRRSAFAMSYRAIAI